MNILIIPSWYPPDGGGFFVNQTKWLKEQGLNPSLIYVEQRSLKSPSAIRFKNIFRFEKSYDSGFVVYRLKTYKIPKFYYLNAFIWRKLTYFLAIKYLRENPLPDLIQVHSCLWGGLVADKIKHKYRIPYVITEHRGRFNEYNFTKAIDIKNKDYKLLKPGLVNANAIIPVSHLQIKTLEEIAGKKLNCFPIPNPVDEYIFKPSDKAKKSKLLTNFYNITTFLPCKAPEILINAFFQASKTENDIFLHFIGDGPDRYKSEKLVHKLHLENKVQFYGFQPSEKVRDLINDFDFLVMSSYNEGQPVVVGESLLCGKPVIGTQIISEIDVPKFAGYLVPVGDSVKLANALIKAHKEKNKFESSEIREFALKRFAKTVVISSIIEVMNTVIKTKKDMAL
jgi:L-malate glycosyltransferase